MKRGIHGVWHERICGERLSTLFQSSDARTAFRAEMDEFRVLDWLSWLVVAAMLVAVALLNGRWLTPNVYTVPLGRCDVDWHVDRAIVALACVGHDMIKVWPLPVEMPWWED
jgi:hypothetical protein